jgi:hypothetical protein
MWESSPTPARSAQFAATEQQENEGGVPVRNIALNFAAIGATWLLVGMTLGIVMGARQDFQFMPVHAHINLIGFACHSIFGITYHQYPAMSSSRLAPYQFWISRPNMQGESGHPRTFGDATSSELGGGRSEKEIFSSYVDKIGAVRPQLVKFRLFV